MIEEAAVQYRWETVGRKADERGAAHVAAAEVRTAGWGGLAVFPGITGLARSMINRGEDNLDAEPLAKGQVGPPRASFWAIRPRRRSAGE